MTLKKDLPHTIPIFPLPGALLLPRGRMPLHIFEPRYLALIEDAMKTPDRLIGMVQPYDSASAVGTLHKIGCAGRLSAFNESDNGRYMITLSGVSRFRIIDEIEGFTPYRRCKVSWAGFDRDLGKAERDPDFARDTFMDALCRFFEDQGLKTDWESLGEAEDELLINSLSMLCPFAPEDKQALLEAPSLSTRRETLMTLIEYALRGGDDEVMQ